MPFFSLFVTLKSKSTQVVSDLAEGSPQTDGPEEEEERRGGGVGPAAQCSAVDQLPLLTMAGFHPLPLTSPPLDSDQLAAKRCCPAPSAVAGQGIAPPKEELHCLDTALHLRCA